MLNKQRLSKSNEYYNAVHPTEAAAVDAQRAEEQAKLEAKAKAAAEAKAAVDAKAAAEASLAQKAPAQPAAGEPQ